jgi:hypothetical protein
MLIYDIIEPKGYDMSMCSARKHKGYDMSMCGTPYLNGFASRGCWSPHARLCKNQSTRVVAIDLCIA